MGFRRHTVSLSNWVRMASKSAQETWRFVRGDGVGCMQGQGVGEEILQDPATPQASGKMSWTPTRLLFYFHFSSLTAQQTINPGASAWIWPKVAHYTEKAMAPHSSTLAWKIPWMEEPCRLQSMGSLRVGHDSVTSLSLFIFMHWRRKWQPTPVFLPRESQGRQSLVGCRLCGRTELDTTEAT